MIPDRSPHERTGYGLRYKGDPAPGQPIGPMGLPATYSKKSDEINRARLARRAYSHIVLASIVLMLGCVSTPKTWHDRMIADSCQRCPHCCTQPNKTRTDEDVLKLCKASTPQPEDCELSSSRKNAQLSTPSTSRLAK